MTSPKTGKRASGNYGIQADNVTADVMAVGDNARASKQVIGSASREELAATVEQLSAALRALNLQPHAKDAIEEDVSALRSEASAEKPKPDRVESLLKNIAGKLKMVGVVLSDVVELSGPATKIASLVGLGGKLLGL